MQIGSPPNYLVLEPSTPLDCDSPWTIEAHAQSLDFNSVVRHRGLFVITSAEVLRSFKSFSELTLPTVELGLTEDGWLRFTRTPRGYIEVAYRIGAYGAQASIEGKVLVDGEFANSVCSELAQMLSASYGRAVA